MVDCSPDAQMWFKRSFTELKTVAVGANSWKRDCPCSVVLHARQIVKGKFLVSMVDEKMTVRKGKDGPIVVCSLMCISSKFQVQ